MSTRKPSRNRIKARNKRERLKAKRKRENAPEPTIDDLMEGFIVPLLASIGKAIARSAQPQPPISKPLPLKDGKDIEAEWKWVN